MERDYSYPFGDPWLVFGSTLEAGQFGLRGVKIPIFRMAYPVYDEVIITGRPFVGLSGMAYITEKIFNLLLANLFLSDQAFGQVPHPFAQAEELAQGRRAQNDSLQVSTYLIRSL